MAEAEEDNRWMGRCEERFAKGYGECRQMDEGSVRKRVR